MWLTWECLEKMEGEGGRWMAFYNCGENSGARSRSRHPYFNDWRSQKHKHVQFIPLPPREEFSPFPDQLVQRKINNDMSIPFQHYISTLPENKTSATLFRTYRRLLFDMKRDNQEEKLSYNFVMTTEWIFISPRTKDDYTEQDQRIAVNSTGMVGLLLTKSEDQTNFVERVGPLNILAYVGKPWPQNIRARKE